MSRFISYDPRAQATVERRAQLARLRALATSTNNAPRRSLIVDCAIVFSLTAFACACFVYMMPAA